MSIKPRILLVASFPPPVHGSSLMSQYIKDSGVFKDCYDCDDVNISTSRKIDEIGRRSPMKLIRWTTALLKLLILLMRHRYQVCYMAITCHGPGFIKDAPFVLLCKLFGNKIVIHQHNKGMANDIDRFPYKWLLPLCYKNVKVILLSWRLYSDVEKIVRKEDVVICPNGIPEIGYEYKDRHNDILHSIFLSNLIESKGVIVLLDALKQLKEIGFSLICDFVGGETKEMDKVRFEREVTKRGLNQTAYFRGPMFGKDKERYLSDADVFVFPTFYHNECFPLVLLEAMQYGLPIITTDEGGISDMIENGVNGLICKKRDAESLAACLEKLISDELLRKRMGEIGYEKFKKKYTLQVFENKMMEILMANA